jgi:tetratricopeptide (TPR) repeat protein
VILLLLPALKFGLVWDDTIFLRDMPDYRDPGLWLTALFRPFVLSPNYFRPLALLTFVGELRLGGQPALLHFTNVLLHAVNTTLVTLLALRLFPRATSSSPASFRSKTPALIGGMLYGLHPALVEGVAFISGRFDLMVTAFLLSGLVADHALRGRPSRSVLVGLSFLAAAFCKEMAVAFALVIPLWHLATGEPGRWTFKRLRQNGNLEVYAAILLAGLTYLGIRFFSLGYLVSPNSGAAIPAGTWVQHLLLVAKSLATYLMLAAWPFTALSPIHYSELPVPVSGPAPWIALVFDALVLFVLIRWARRAPASGWLALGAILALLPVVNILPLELGGGAFVAERFLMFPIALAAIALGRALAGAFARSWAAAPLGARALGVIPMVWLAAAAVTLQLTVPNWRDDLTLWAWAAAREPRSATPYTNLALQYVQLSQPEVAAQLANHALELEPENGDAWDNLGLALFQSGEYAEAQRAFENAVANQPQNALFWNNLAGALREQDQLAEAEAVLVDRALQLNPSLPAAHLNLGLVYMLGNRPDLATPYLQQAVRLLPPDQASQAEGILDQVRDPEIWLRLGEVLLTDGDADGAAQAFSQAQALGASVADVAVGLSAALIEVGDLESAEEVLLEAMQSSPEDARLYNNMGIVAREQGDVEAARQYFSRAAELAPDWDMPQQNLDALPQL